MDVKVNLLMPELLYKESQALVKKGIYSNFSELVRQAVRLEIHKYKEPKYTKADLRLRELLMEGYKNGHFLNETEAAKLGIKV